MRYFNLKALIAFYISVALTGSTWAASRDQIIGAINEIWTNLPGCNLSTGGRIRSGNHEFFSNGYLHADKLRGGLKKENFVHFITRTSEENEETFWGVMFNPADLKDVTYEEHKYSAEGFRSAGTERLIRFNCEPSKECVFFNGYMRWQYSARLSTCASETEVNRINNALQDLKQHYKPTPKPLY